MSSYQNVYMNKINQDLNKAVKKNKQLLKQRVLVAQCTPIQEKNDDTDIKKGNVNNVNSSKSFTKRFSSVMDKGKQGHFIFERT